MRAWIAIAVIAVAIACGPRPPPRGPQVDEITALWAQIRDWRRDAGWPVDPRHEDEISVTRISVSKAASVCPNAQLPPKCNDVCSLADAICDNAEQICILADQLGKDDAWAQEKCTSAKASCRDAKRRCCECGDNAQKAP